MGYIHIRKQLDELEKVLNVLDTSNRDLTDDEQHIIDNFPYTFAQAITCDIYPDACKQIINHLVSMTDDNDWFDEYVKVVRCGWCKWWKDNRCTNVNGAYGNTILNPSWFCRSGESVTEDT